MRKFTLKFTLREHYYTQAHEDLFTLTADELMLYRLIIKEMP